MNREQLQRLREALDEALRLADDARADHLQDLRRRDPALAAAVATALAECERDDPTFEPLLAAPPLADPPAAPAPGDRLGPWRLCQPLGTGGMGEVWLAERADGAYQQRVAIKFPHGTAQTAAGIARFERERNLLAELDLPGVARLVDGGWTSPGQPWLAMEFVSGQRIDTFAAARGLDARARARLLRDAARTLAAAHDRRIVHRDLKPQNLLVRDDGSVALVDFGIATVLGEPGQGLASYLATPKYAAPEQLRGESASAAADVYSLALVGRELLADADGDLAAVLAQAAHQDHRRRTATAAAFADELDRWLAHQPVLARPPGLARRAKLSWRRDPRTALLLASAASAAVTLFAASLWLWRGEHRQRQRADAALLAEASQHAQVRRLVGELVTGVHDRVRTLAGAVPVRNFVLERADEHLTLLLPRATEDASLAAELVGVQLRLAEVRGARTFGHSGDPEGAMRSVDTAIDLARRWAARHDRELHWRRSQADALRLRGDLWRNRGEHAAARRDYRAAETLLAGSTTRDDRRLLAVLALQLGKLDVLAGDPGAGADGIAAAADAFEALLGAAPSDPQLRRDLAHAYSELGYAATSLGDHERSSAAWQRARAELATLCKARPDDAQLARDRIEIDLELALDHGHAGRRDTAIAEYATALAAARALADTDRDNLLAARLFDQALLRGARLYTVLGDHAQAATSYRQAEPRLRAAAERAPSDLALRRDLAEALAGRAEAERLLGQTDGLAAVYEDALALLPHDDALARRDHLAGNLITLAWVGLGNLCLARQQPEHSRRTLLAASPQATAWAEQFAHLHWPLRHLGALEYALGTACETLANDPQLPNPERHQFLTEAEAAFQRGLAAANQLAAANRLHRAERALPTLFAKDVARIQATRATLPR